MGWGTGEVLDVTETDPDVSSYCDSCGQPVMTGCTVGVRLTPWKSRSPAVYVLCESCFGDIAGEDTQLRPGTRFEVLHDTVELPDE